MEAEFSGSMIRLAIVKRSSAWYILKSLIILLIKGKSAIVLQSGTREQKCVFDAVNMALDIYWSGKPGSIHIDEKRLVYRQYE